MNTEMTEQDVKRLAVHHEWWAADDAIDEKYRAMRAALTGPKKKRAAALDALYEQEKMEHAALLVVYRVKYDAC